ncbi:hypothetical protein [Pelagicoccus sp. SDUM812003]|uniref:hypothetical protein n=1 Tax=Pelagicoccus sp. SDUM812003 TaxID=3041267 RepID=UPI00280F8FBA|nr:hypothetical protein [Pelagicoccus sp. SDUM812003]MDQ8202350.1 hypothetical protein [Pelagicoccus sp. SDUM812003]
MRSPARSLLALLLCFSSCHWTQAQFADFFDDGNVEDWQTLTGDGWAEMQFLPQDDFARLEVDASNDRYNVWWAIIKRDVSKSIDMEKLALPGNELRIEARIRLSEAPRRVNIMINTQRTVDFHQQLAEYDISESGEWRTISYTTKNFDAVPGDQIFVQLGVTDWGIGRYHVDVDYYKADIVNVDTADPELGEPLIYHPPVPDLDSFEQRQAVSHDALVNLTFPEVCFHEWGIGDEKVLTISDRQHAILRWDLSKLRETGSTAVGPGILEITTHSVATGGQYVEAFGEDLGIEFEKIRVFELLGGKPDWDQRHVSLNSLQNGSPLTSIVNSQMTFDVELTAENGGKTYITLPRPVMQRLLDGTTRGLLIKPLGAIDASIYDSEDARENVAPTLHFTTKS